MRLLISVLFAARLVAQTYQMAHPSPGWETVLRSLGQLPTSGTPHVLVHPSTESAGGILILEGHSPLAGRLGIARAEGIVKLRQIRDVASPELPIVWANEAEIESAKLSSEWQIRARDRWSGEAVLAIRKLPQGAVLWTATEIGASGYERYPFLPQALLAAGLETSVEGRGLWAFFDASFRYRVDLPYLIAQWKRAGISAIHVTSWQFDGAPAERLAWLNQLIALCHENLIQVYAWVELPHVSGRFWNEHPECRERTATGMEASLDWRRLINLVHPGCAAMAEADLLTLLRSQDWDGVNLGELYFESLEGHGNPARFTPFNDDVRADYQKRFGRDPLEDLSGEGLPRLLQYRADLAAQLQSDWLSKLATIREAKPDFDIVLTHIDDRFDTGMRDALGADAARLLRGTEGLNMEFLIEDPATVWHLGPKRYAEIRQRYQGLTDDPGRLAIDLNIVDRYQDVYPTKRQTGAELAQLLHEASSHFAQVALYFEYSLRPVDLPLLGMASAPVTHWKRLESGNLEIRLSRQARVRWRGAARVNGMLWPLMDGESLLLPAGEWQIEAAEKMPAIRVVDSNLKLLGVRPSVAGYEIDYECRAAGALLVEEGDGRKRIPLPRGQGSFRLSATPTAAPAVNSSAQALLRP
ncbi:hypothetical protein [Bryobacter aggregatus]|uniref:hypothetical protein n=1 Tax=Bryobacter aggregatus TaxID=360054 RepID=UPI0004E0BB11|nr:hypothetical protein [Bryobacter aggregatus]